MIKAGAARSMKSDSDSGWHSACGISISSLKNILKCSQGQWQELVIINIVAAIADLYVSFCMCSNVVTVVLFPHWRMLVCPLHLSFHPQTCFYFNLALWFLSIAAPCPPCSVQASRTDPLNWSLVVPHCVTVMLKNPHLHVSNPPPKAPILHWSCSVRTLAGYYVFLLCAMLHCHSRLQRRAEPYCGVNMYQMAECKTTEDGLLTILFNGTVSETDHLFITIINNEIL